MVKSWPSQWNMLLAMGLLAGCHPWTELNGHYGRVEVDSHVSPVDIRPHCS